MKENKHKVVWRYLLPTLVIMALVTFAFTGAQKVFANSLQNTKESSSPTEAVVETETPEVQNNQDENTTGNAEVQDQDEQGETNEVDQEEVETETQSDKNEVDQEEINQVNGEISTPVAGNVDD